MDLRSKNHVIVCALLIVMGGVASEARSDGAPLSFSYQARVYDSTGTIPITEEVKVVFGIYSQDGACLLYEEIQNEVDLSDSNGLLSLQVGTVQGASSRTVNDQNLSMVTIYSNMGTSILPAGTAHCAAGYQPAFGESRMLKVNVYNQAGILISNVTESINSVPTSLVAETLQGLAADRFINVAAGVTQVNMDALTNGSDASTLHDHDGRYMPLSGPGGDVFFSGTHRVGIGTNTSPADIGFGGGVSRSIQVDRSTVGDGNSLSLQAGGGQSGSPDRMGGNLILSSGLTTGNGQSTIEFKTSGSNVSGSGDNSLSTKMVILGNGNVGIGVLNPVKALEVNGDAKATQFCLLGVCIGDWTQAGKGGTVTTVTAGMGILKDGAAGANLTVAGTLSVDVGITSGKIAQVGAGDVVPLSIIPVVDTAHIGSQAVTTAEIANGTIKVEDLNTTETDGRYVLKTGYTMTGQLVLPTNGLAVGGTQLVASGGSVGIGTNTPNAALEVREGGVAPFLQTIRFGDTSGVAHLGAGATYYGLSNSVKTPDLVILQSNGNVGIGTTNPTAKLEVNGAIKATSVDIASVRHYYETRTLPTVANSTVDIGVFSIPNSGNDLDVAITVTSTNFSASKRYIIPTQYGGIPAWSSAIPISSSNSGNANDFSLEVIQIDGPDQLSLRIRRTLGSTAGTAIIHMQQRGSSATTFTPSVATASGVAAVSATVGSTVVAQVDGKVGMGTMSPANKLSVVGNASIGFNTESAPANSLIVSGNVGIGTATPAATLEVRSATPSIVVGKSDNTEGALYLGNSGHGIKRNYGGVANDVGLFTTSADVYLSGNGVVTNQFVVKNSGNVGIGTNTPSSTLDVGGTSNTAHIQNLSTWGLNARVQGLNIMPEGTVTDDGSGKITFGDNIIIMNPLSGSYIRVAAGSYTLGNWDALWAPIPPAGSRGTTVTPTVTAWADGDRNYDGRDRVLLAQRNGTGKIYTRFTQPGNTFEDFASTTTSATPVTLGVGSAPRQQFIGSANQTVVLPVATTLAVGQTYTFFNRSTGTVTVKASDGTTTITTLPPSSQNTFIATNITTANGIWDTSSNAGVNVTSVTGVLPVGNGGTGSSAALSPGGIMYGSSSSVATTAAAGTAGYLLMSGGTGAPAWTTSPSLTSLTLATALPIGSGGTGASTKIAAFDALSPMTTLGDIVFGNAAGTGTRLAGNTTPTKQFLSSTGASGLATAPTWGALTSGDLPAIALTGDVSGSAASGSITTAIGAGKVTNTMLAGSIASSKLVGTDIATVGTITSGTWNGTAITETRGGTNQTSYVTGDTLYASGTNTLSKLPGNTTTTVKFLTQAGNGSVSAAPEWSSSMPGMGFTGPIVSNNGTHALGQHHFILQTGGFHRVGMGLLGNETGSNVGSDFSFWNYADNGTFLGTPFTIKRSTGNVGIGTSNPTATLEVRSETPSIVVGKSDLTDGALYLGNPSHGIKRNYNAANDVGVYTSGVGAGLYLAANGPATNQFVVKGTGNVGIGTDTPGSLLTVGAGSFPINQRPGINVATNGDSYVTVSDNTKQVILGADVSGTGMVGTYSNHNFAIRSNNLERIRVAAGGNVGIGTANPLAALDVNGVVKATSVDIASVRHYNETRTLPTVANSIVEIGKFYQLHSGVSLDVSITVSDVTFSVSKRYVVTSQLGDNTGTWRTVLPLANTGQYSNNDFELEMLLDPVPNELNLRIRRVGAGTTAGTANVHIQARGASSALYTASAATAAGVAATSGNFESTVLTQLDGKVGVGTKAPVNNLSVLGNASIGYNGDVAPASSLIVSGNVGVGTATPASKVSIEGNANSLRLQSTGAGLHNYLSYYADGGAAARSGWIGYGFDGSLDLTLANEKTGGGDVILLPNSGKVGIGTNVTPAGSLAIGNSTDTDAFKIGAPSTRHHLVSNRDMVFNAFDSNSGAVGTPLFYFRKDTNRFDEFTYTDLLTITDQGWVGVGTTSPNAPFHVAENPRGTTASLSPTANGVQISGGDVNGVAAIELTYNGGLPGPYIDFKNDISGANDYDIRFILNGDNQLNLEGGDLLVNGNKVIATQFCFPGNVCTTNWGAGGSVTSVATGSGLTGGPITTSGTISVATDGITTTHLAAGTVALTDMNLTDVDTRYARKSGGDNVVLGTISFTPPAGDASPTITARTVPAGQGASSEKTELILFHSNDNYSSGPDQITLRAPALSFQTYNNGGVGDINNNAGYNERMYITPDGNVGIGTITPGAMLEVRGSVGSASLETIRFGDVGGSAHIGAGNLYYGFSNQSKFTDLAILQSNGNVGIGTTNPSVKLEVNGTIKATSVDIGSVKHYYETRTLPVVVNSTVDIGVFSIVNSGHDLDVAITVSNTNFSVSKRYMIPTQYGGVPAWSLALPLSNSDSGNANDFALEVFQNDGSDQLSLRIRRTLGATAGTAIIHMQQRGSSATSFTPSSTAAAGVAAVTAKVGSTMLAQKNGRVGIGTEAPVNNLHVKAAIDGEVGILNENTSAGSAAYSIFRQSSDTGRLVMFTNSSTRTTDGGVGNTTIRTDNAGSKLFLSAGGGQTMAIDSTGNVGIGMGMTAPAQQLHTAGTARFDGGVQVDGNTVIDNDGGWHRSYGATGWFNQTYGGGIYMNDNWWVKTFGSKSFWVDGAIMGTWGNVGVGISNPTSKVEIQKDTRSGTHPTGKALYVTSDMGAGSALDGGFEVRHSNGTSGIGMGYNTIYATGSNANQELVLKAKGAGTIQMNSFTEVIGSNNFRVTNGNASANQFCFNGGACTSTWGGGGTVTNIATGSGLTGGAITGTGTISVATGGITAAHLAADVDTRYVNAGVGGDTMTGNLMVPKISVGANAIEGNVDINAGTADTQATIASGAFTYGAEKADLVLTRRHGAYTAGFGYPASLIDFRGTNTVEEASLAQIMSVLDTNSGTSWSGGLAFLTSPGGSTDPAGRRSKGAAPITRMLIDRDGKVGIGTTVPGSLLTVGPGTFPNGQLPGVNVATGSDSYVTVSDNTRQVFLGADSSGYGMVGTYSNHDFVTRTNNAERMRVTSGGNVGIGVTNPAYKLDVNGTANISSTLNVVNGFTLNSGTPANNYIGGNLHLSRADTHSIFGTTGNFDLIFNTNNSEKMRLTSTGRLGIGTSAPASTLDVLHPSTPSILVGTSLGTHGAVYLGNASHGIMRNYSGANDVGVYTTSGDLYLSGAGAVTNQFVLKNSGNVGIGTATPNNKLEINGGALSIYHPGNWTAVGLDYDSAANGGLGQLRIRSNNNTTNLNQTNMVINRVNGNVGIGTVAPAQQLHTSAVGRFDGGVQVAGGLGVIDADGGWHRSHGVAGWYNQTYGGGLYMADTTYVRVWGDKNMFIPYGSAASPGTDSTTVAGVYIGKSATGEASIELAGYGNAAKIPFIDFTRNSGVDFDARLMLTGNDVLDVQQSDFKVTGGGTSAGKIFANQFCINGGSCISSFGGAGTVTSIATGTGLSGGTITTSGTISANFGTSAGTITEGNDSRLSNSRAPNGAASGDLSGSYPSPSVASVGGQAASTIAAGAVLANNATSGNSASQIVRRDGNGDFSARNINANVTFATTGDGCSSGNAGTMKFVAGGSGVSDKMQACLKNSGGSYAWTDVSGGTSYSCASGGYALASIGGTKLMAFVFAPVGTSLRTDAEYRSFCNSRGFEQNLNSNTVTEYTSAGMSNTSNYYCNSHCCYLGVGNSRAGSISGFQNYGLPLSSSLQVIDRGCGLYSGGTTGNASFSWTIGDTINLSGATTYTYTPGPGHWGVEKGVVTVGGSGAVVVCQQY